MDEIKWNNTSKSFEYGDHSFIFQSYGDKKNHYQIWWQTHEGYERNIYFGLSLLGRTPESPKCDIYANSVKEAKEKAIKVIKMWLDLSE